MDNVIKQKNGYLFEVKKSISSEFIEVLFNSATTGYCSKMYLSPYKMLHSPSEHL
jgi:hypothetical protein